MGCQEDCRDDWEVPCGDGKCAVDETCSNCPEVGSIVPKSHNANMSDMHTTIVTPSRTVAHARLPLVWFDHACPAITLH